MNHRIELPGGLSVTMWLPLVLLCLIALFVGCDMPVDPTMKLDQAKPKVDLLRLDFDRSNLEIDVHTKDQLSVFNDQWMATLTPITGEALINTELALRRIIRQGGETYHSSSTESEAKGLTVYRYLRVVKNDHFVSQGDYLINIDGYWLNGVVFSRKTLSQFDQRQVDQFFFSLKLLDQPQPDHEVLPAWKEYQQTRTADSPDGKFSLYMDPAPVCLGSYDDYLARLDASSSYLDMAFTEEDYANGGRMIGNEILEFYSLDDPTGIRVDIWVDRQPMHGVKPENIYANTLTIEKSPVNLWSFDEPCTLEIEPGRYDVEIVLVNRGKYSEEFLFDRDQFQRDDLERYEIYLTRTEEPSK
ncbi:hypothetical protein C5Y96_03785 [Blastopirellula marina]|uniref:Uncharacterized protein n=1 Tax=Blastopirellula marina TaxID=124 RepID=A0A2S8G423_9BACT|nr:MULTISPECIES: hypothetical protein [Pirellulaceae]PQO39001.1 hypothetical protein C5Y96_03785 [Blastopirellula marina]RCS55309.1 hypothetical protein DTL36_03790 [Bremerella cremea]